MTRQRQTHGRAAIAVALAAFVAAIVPVRTVSAAAPVDVVFGPTGAEQQWTVPAGVTSVHVVLVGGRGGTPSVSSIPARGHRVEGDLIVSPGDVLYVEVGGNGAGGQPLSTGAAGGFNGGASGGQGGLAGSGGGGASDLRTSPRNDAGSLASRLIVAGGGGGYGSSAIGGDAGAAGADGNTGIIGGGPGTGGAGGAGGSPNGATGTLGSGGAGGGSAGGGGGGGGGGYYGGGGGGGVPSTSVGGAAGGGGSSYTGAATNTLVSLSEDAAASVTITYTPADSPSQSPGPTVAPGEVLFSFTGGEQSWTVPAGVTTIHVSLLGGVGGEGIAPGGRGGSVQGDLAVSPGDVLYVEVGGNGAAAAGDQTEGRAGGFNGGGTGGFSSSVLQSSAGGGGASDIRTIARSAPGSLASRLMVAAGGGGAAGYAKPGGDAGQPGGGAAGGGAGTSTAGGAGGGSTPPGSDGSLGLGGAGSTGEGGGGAGGGGGLYGGGGGGGFFSGGGGGGSSFTGGATNASAGIGDHIAASITISWGGTPPDPTPGPDSGVVDATISMASSVCIELSTASVDFGTGQFGEVGVGGAPDIVVTNCGTTPQALFAHGTNATAPGASWTLVTGTATCADTLGLDAYHLSLVDAVTQDDSWGLGLSNTLLGTVGVGSTGSYGPTIDTACPGSSGAGAQMTMQIIFTATLSEP